jgi:hypothetical protein
MPIPAVGEITDFLHILVLKIVDKIYQDQWNTRVEAGSNTSTVTLRVVRGDEMGLKKRPRHSLSG